MAEANEQAVPPGLAPEDARLLGQLVADNLETWRSRQAGDGDSGWTDEDTANAAYWTPRYEALLPKLEAIAFPKGEAA